MRQNGYGLSERPCYMAEHREKRAVGEESRLGPHP